jgi:hypothetical protein
MEPLWITNYSLESKPAITVAVTSRGESCGFLGTAYCVESARVNMALLHKKFLNIYVCTINIQTMPVSFLLMSYNFITGYTHYIALRPMLSELTLQYKKSRYGEILEASVRMNTCLQVVVPLGLEVLGLSSSKSSL